MKCSKKKSFIINISSFGMSGWVWALIIIGCLIFLVLIIVGIILAIRSSKHGPSAAPLSSVGPPITPTSVQPGPPPGPTSNAILLGGIPASQATGNDAAFVIVSVSGGGTVTFTPNRSFTSPNGLYTLTLQPYGLTEKNNNTGDDVWDQVFLSQGQYIYVFQPDGNFVVKYAPNGSTQGQLVWSTQITNPGPDPYTLSLNNVGNLIITNGNGTPLWANCVNSDPRLPANICHFAKL